MTQVTAARPPILIVRREDGLRPGVRRRLERAGFRIASLRGGRGRKGATGDPIPVLAGLMEHLGFESHILNVPAPGPATGSAGTTSSSGSSRSGRLLDPISLDTAGLDRLEIADEGISLEAVERALLSRALEQTGGNQSKAARLLGLSRQTLIYRMQKYGIGRRSAP